MLTVTIETDALNDVGKRQHAEKSGFAQVF
jgi:hypothetical protein